MSAGVGRGEPDLTDVYCTRLALRADYPTPAGTDMEAEFLARLLTEIKIGNAGYWLLRFRKAQSKKPRQNRK